jgi:hypothetical protein
MINLNATTTNVADCATSRIMVRTTRWLQGTEIAAATTKKRIIEIAITVGKNWVPASPSDQEHREITINRLRIS